MIGDKRLEMPKRHTDIDEKINDIIKYFGLPLIGGIDSRYMTAKRLVELNNEVYNKLHDCETCKNKYPKIETSDYCRMCGGLRKGE